MGKEINKELVSRVRRAAGNAYQSKEQLKESLSLVVGEHHDLSVALMNLEEGYKPSEVEMEDLNELLEMYD